jgi:hypothetical protein
MQYIKAFPPVLFFNLDVCVMSIFANVHSVVKQKYPETSGVIKEDEFKFFFE